MKEKTNYDYLKFLAKDGGYYDVAGHLTVLQKAFPRSSIDIKQVRKLRQRISESNDVVYDFHMAKSRQKALRVISVDPKYAIHSKPPSEQREKITDSYLRCGHETEIRAIQLRRQFDQLLSGCRGLSQR